MGKQVIEDYVDNYKLSNRMHRLLWNVCWAFLFRPFALPVFHTWRRFILILFGAKIGKSGAVYASAKIWAPWNLELGEYGCIGPHARIYNPGRVILGKWVSISQYSYLCTATHDYEDKLNTLYWKDIRIGNYVWVAAEAFVGPGVTIGEGAVVGARAAVFKNVESWTVVGGNPAKFIKKRVIRKEN